MYNRIFPIWVVAKNSFADFIYGKAFFATVAAVIFIMFATFISTEFTFGVPERSSLDVGLGLVSLTSLIFSVIWGCSVIPDEIESRTVFMIITRPISRFQFLVGKTVGVYLYLICNFLVLTTVSTSLFYLYGGNLQSYQWLGITILLLESLIVLLISIFFSLFLSKMLAMVTSLSVYLAGQFIPQILDTSIVVNLPWLKQTLKILMWFFPDFNKLNIRDHIYYSRPFSLQYIYTAYLYTGLYILIFIVLGAMIIKNKDFE
ncbi:MAG: ABC transporter permease subunit [Bacteriovoracaceae bacterium]|nr:ABC transporter permease subunit [Bacteriovoracaceae bacterium]